MLTIHYPIDISLQYPIDKEYDLDKVAFFDIETTGFSADTTYLYLIGCIYHQNSSFHIVQWFAEDIKEEELLLTSFFEFLKDYEVLIHYNGSGFDIPYILRKCIKLKLNYSFESIRNIDLFKKIAPFKTIIKLPNYKQKTVEDFFQVKRSDILDGGDLIQIYANYLGRKHYENLRHSSTPYPTEKDTPTSKELLRLLLLHNEDDLKGLLHICPILSYSDLTKKSFYIEKLCLNDKLLSIQIVISIGLPFPLHFKHGEFIQCTITDKSVLLNIDVFHGELKYFYDNYQDYYYLPQEDMAVHKSLASFVDKEFRSKAKAANCYAKKTSIFVPQYDDIIKPSFKQNHKDKITFFEFTKENFLPEEDLKRYASHILTYIITNK